MCPPTVLIHCVGMVIRLVECQHATSMAWHVERALKDSEGRLMIRVGDAYCCSCNESRAERATASPPRLYTSAGNPWPKLSSLHSYPPKKGVLLPSLQGLSGCMLYTVSSTYPETRVSGQQSAAAGLGYRQPNCHLVTVVTDSQTSLGLHLLPRLINGRYPLLVRNLQSM